MQNNKYPNWLVSVEQAERLKELDFNEPCIFSYSEGIGITACIRIGSGDEPNFTDFIIGGNSPGSPLTDLPTYEQVFEWFRKKGFHSHIEYTSDNDMFKINIFGILLQTGISYFKTYEEAREELVNKLIEVYKKEKRCI